jgi:multicomponent Na+:H+ antiporter subunit C
MEVLYCLLTGALFGISVYLLLQANTMLILFGIIILSSAVNLLIFVIGRIHYAAPPFVNEQPLSPMIFAAPLPQALILTAIVISFGLIAYLLVLVRTLWQEKKTLSIHEDQDEV